MTCVSRQLLKQLILTELKKDKSQEMQNIFENTLITLLTLLKVNVTKTSVRRFLQNHPENGTMLAYSDALTNFNVENAAAEIIKEDLLLLPTPFIASSVKDKGVFMVVKSVTNESVQRFDTKTGWVHENMKSFLSHWNGVVLFAETNENSGEKDFTSKLWKERRKKLRIPLALSLLTILLIGLTFKAGITEPYLHIILGLKLIGMVLTGFLLAHAIGIKNKVIEKICTVNGKSGCEKVLKSEAAKIFSWLSLSDIGFVYFFGSFFGQLLCLHFRVKPISLLGFHLLLSIPAIAFSLYSIYYQAFKVKQWCKLCLGVVTVLLVEGATVFSEFSGRLSPTNYTLILAMIFGFSIPTIFLLLFKSTAIEAQKSIEHQSQLFKLKSSPYIFRALIARQRTMPTITKEMKTIFLGDKSLRNTITLVSNPLCRPCAQMHQRVEKLIGDNPKSVNCRLIFSASRKGEDDGVKFIETIYSLPKGMRVEAIHQWYSRETVDYDFWKKEYDHFEQKKQGANIRLKHNEWCNTASIKYTPTIYFNGQKLPELYEVEDVLNHLEDDETSREEPVYGFANHLI